jgi:hypothetical protein
MVVGGFKIARNDSIRTNPLSLVFLGLIVVFLCRGYIGTGGFASYRFGDSIIPEESQLTKTGPYSMKVINKRVGKTIRFIPIDKESTTYNEDWLDFDMHSWEVLKLADQMQGEFNVYLGVYYKNPVRQVWSVEANGKIVQSYQRSIHNYYNENASGYNYVRSSLIMVFVFLISLFNIERLKKS